MTSEEQRAAIAEACGWETNTLTRFSFGQDVKPDFGHLPDYLNDLNAMHEAEKELELKHGGKSVGNLHRNYLLHLMNVMNPGVKLWDNGTYLGDWAHAIKAAEATAAQRAEAFLRALGKWKD